MITKKQNTISWDTQLIKELMKVANVCEESLKDNIRVLCLIVNYRK